MNTNTFIRQAIRQQRKQLTSAERTLASQTLTLKLIQYPFFLNSYSIACYWTINGEIETQPIIDAIWSLKKTCYLPILNKEKKILHFGEYTKDTILEINAYGIAEPITTDTAIEKLDLILLPLVAFDNKGHRLGMGGGYYDRSLAFLSQTPRPKKPLLIGLAYEFQQQKVLIPQPWDIVLDGIITEKALYIANKKLTFSY